MHENKRKCVNSLGILKCLLILTLIFSVLPLITADAATQTTTTRSFSEISDALENPYMGWVKYGSDKTYNVGNNLIFARITWRELEATKGVYDFTAFENSISYKYWISKGYKFILLFNMDWPDYRKGKDIPEWLYNEIDGHGTWYKTPSGSGGFSPDYNNTALISEHRKLIEKFAERYDNSNTYEILLGSVGHWGEMHTTYIYDTSAPGAQPKVDVENMYMQAYVDNFHNVYISSRQTRAIARDNKMALHNHGFGDYNQVYTWFLTRTLNGYTDYYTKDTHPAYPDFWKNGPTGAEGLTWPHTQYFHDSTINSTVQMGKDMHLTWLMAPPERYLTDEIKANMNKLLRVMGYRLVLNNVTYSNVVTSTEPLTITMNWTNTGVAPCYFEWPMEISLSDKSGKVVFKSLQNVNLKSWIPGSRQLNFNINIPTTLAPGVYNLAVAIIDTRTSLPGVKLAFNASSVNGRYQIGQVNVNPIKVYVNNTQVQFDVQPQIINNWTMVPLRAIFTALGATVDYNSATRVITVTKDDVIIMLTVGSTRATVNGVSIILDAPATIVSQRTLVPLRFISETLGADVRWDGTTRSVYISSPSF